MMTSVSTAIVVAALTGAPDPCGLLTAADITAALGAAPSDAKAVGPIVDEDLKGMSWTCEQQVGKRFLLITVIEFATAAAAVQGWTAMMKQSDGVAEAFKLQAASGLGDQAASGAGDEGAMWVARKGKYILNVLSGGDVTPSARLLEPLKRLAGLALGKLVA